ncbi:MAG: DUF7490 domain-containing protein [Candidatus Syntropharchaeia archaeon]
MELKFVFLVIIAFFIFLGVVAIGGGLRKEGSSLRIGDVDISADVVNGDALLNITVYIQNAGGTSGNVSFLLKAYDGETNLLVTKKEKEVGKIGRERTKISSVEIAVPMEGNYLLRILLFEDGKNIQSGEVRIRGLSSLDPLRIRELDFFVEKSEGDYAIINTTMYIDNRGKKDIPELRALVKARDNETKLIKDQIWVNLGSLKKDSTNIRSVELKVLSGRDYIVEIQIWSGEKIIKEGKGMVILSPFGRSLGEKTTKIAPEFEITDFIPESEEKKIPRPVPAPGIPEGMPRAAIPGFEGLIGILAISLVYLLKRGR